MVSGMGAVLGQPRSPANDAPGEVAPQAELIARFDVAGPRYTSYPTADRFVEAFGPVEFGPWLEQRASLAWRHPLSVYVHLPFCESVCYYCACNKIVTRDRGRARAYVLDLVREIALYADGLGRREPVSQLHFGGGTPTFADGPTLQSALDALERAFAIAPDAERSIEVDPRTVDRQRLRELRVQRFNRVSFGVQDFDPQVQQAVHRAQSAEHVFELTAEARAIGFESVNVDLIYGLPRQSASSFQGTLDTLARLRPDRVALYGYAHLPERFKPQRRIQTQELPTAHQKLSMMRMAIERLAEAGYVFIGMDHFALPQDALAVAQRRGTLHRNFMGYTTQPDCDMLGLGVSAIGRMGPCYAQNHRTIEHWADAVRAGRLPIARGCELSRDDMLRRSAIMAIICGARLSFAALQNAYLVDPKLALSDELARLREFEDLGLVRVDPEGITVTPRGRYFARPIAMVFDRYLRSALTRAAYSRVL